MSESQSRVLLTTEAIIICAPLTVLLLVRELPAQIRQLLQTPEPEALGIFASGLFMLAALLCLWRLIVTFTVHGGAALHRVSAHVWALAALAAALALRMAVHYAPAASDPALVAERICMGTAVRRPAAARLPRALAARGAPAGRAASARKPHVGQS